MKSGSMHQRCAYAFLFDGSVEGLPSPQLAYFTGEVLTALSVADPCGRTRSQFRVGMPMLSKFAERTTGVHGFERGSGRTVSHNMDVFTYVVWEWLDSLVEGWHSIDSEAGMEIFRLHTGECLALSSLDDEIRDGVDRYLKSVRGYVGAFKIDPGNLLHRAAFFELLIHAAAIENGAVVQELSYEGEQEWQLEGSAEFQPNGTVWQPSGWLSSFGPKRLERDAVSERGAKAASRLRHKQSSNLEERVLEELSQVFFAKAARATFAFKSTSKPTDILQAILPEGKFTKYLFDRTHKDGKSKAAFLIDELSIDPEDWRYLAGQFYFGLLLARPENVRLNNWEKGYGAKFEVQMHIRNRAGKTATLTTGWNMNPGSLPSFSTAFPGRRDQEAIEPGDPPILLPGQRSEADWAALWQWANAAGLKAGADNVPTPMFLCGVGAISEGECGTALVRVLDARRGMARWLKRQGLGKSDGLGGAVVYSPIPTQSLDRANTWARTVVSILTLNGINADVQSFCN